MAYQKPPKKFLDSIYFEEIENNPHHLDSFAEKIVDEWLKPGISICIEVDVDRDGSLLLNNPAKNIWCRARIYAANQKDMAGVYDMKVTEVVREMVIRNRTLMADKRMRPKWPFEKVPTVLIGWNKSGFKIELRCFDDPLLKKAKDILYAGIIEANRRAEAMKTPEGIYGEIQRLEYQLSALRQRLLSLKHQEDNAFDVMVVNHQIKKYTAEVTELYALIGKTAPPPADYNDIQPGVTEIDGWWYNGRLLWGFQKEEGGTFTYANESKSVEAIVDDEHVIDQLGNVYKLGTPAPLREGETAEKVRENLVTIMQTDLYRQNYRTKGAYLGLCNRTACEQKFEPVFWNPSTRAYYCGECARAIDPWMRRDSNGKLQMIRHMPLRGDAIDASGLPMFTKPRRSLTDVRP